MKALRILLFVFLFLNLNVLPQSNFNLDAYKLFLQSHQNMVSQDLLQMYPAGTFKANVNQSYSDALFFRQIDSIYNLTAYEKELITSNGFMVTERLSRNTFGHPLLEIYHKDLPVYISSDAVLHALHQSYDRILKDIELGMLISRVGSLLNGMHQKMPLLAARYSSNSGMNQPLKDVDVYLTVARRLLNNAASPYYTENNSDITYYIGKVNAHAGLNPEFIFAEHCREVDWSQFEPRGHYIDEFHPELAEYFKAMMWLGRIELYLSAPKNVHPMSPCLSDFYDVQRQTIMSVLLMELYELANSSAALQEIEGILKFFVGESDNVAMPDLLFMKQAVQFQFADELLDSLMMVTFEDTLLNQSFAHQKILSQVLYSNPMVPDSIVPASAFLLFGQRFVIDSYVMATVVFDRIKYNNSKICRLFPSTLDPIFAIGNDAAAQLLQPELDAYMYSTNLAGLRYLIDSYTSEFWESSIYNQWLYGIKSLNPPADRSGLPLYMQSAAFWQKELNTQLTSWTQLRHDNLLYAKQSYTGGTICSFPYTYVEPFPELYGALNSLGNNGIQKFQQINFPDPNRKSKILDYFGNLKNISATLKGVTEKELSGTPYTQSEIEFLHKVIYDSLGGSGNPPFKGWYTQLLYDDPDGEDALLKQDFIVADVHTVPTDCFGNPLGAVVHVGTGPVNMGVFIADVPGNAKTAFIGPVYSYYNYTTLNYERLNDEDWKTTYLYQSLRPDWVNVYLADSSGNSRGSGPTFITGIETNPTEPPSEYLIVKNYPNPFNPTTTISFNVPHGLAFSSVSVSIYNIQGELVRSLYQGELPQGNYLVKWDGTNNGNAGVSSGIYFCRVNVGDVTGSVKMMFLK
jgi:hypothetical protein